MGLLYDRRAYVSCGLCINFELHQMKDRTMSKNLSIGPPCVHVSQNAARRLVIAVIL